jgi:predicted small secreted protein
MKKIIFVFMATASLVACTETWQGVKQDTKEVTRSVGDAGNQLVDKVKESLSNDTETQDEKEGEK